MQWCLESQPYGFNGWSYPKLQWFLEQFIFNVPLGVGWSSWGLLWVVFLPWVYILQFLTWLWPSKVYNLMMAWLQPSPAIVAHLTQPMTIDMASETLLSLAGASKRGVSFRLLVPEAAALLQRSKQVRCQSRGRDPAIDGPRGVPRKRNWRTARGRLLGDRRKYRKSGGENDDIQRICHTYAHTLHHHHHHHHHHLNMPVFFSKTCIPLFSLQKIIIYPKSHHPPRGLWAIQVSIHLTSWLCHGGPFFPPWPISVIHIEVGPFKKNFDRKTKHSNQYESLIEDIWRYKLSPNHPFWNFLNM